MNESPLRLCLFLWTCCGRRSRLARALKAPLCEQPPVICEANTWTSPPSDPAFGFGIRVDAAESDFAAGDSLPRSGDETLPLSSLFAAAKAPQPKAGRDRPLRAHR